MSIKVSWLSVCCNGVELSQEPPVLVALDNTDLGLEISFFNCRYFRMISQVLIAQGIDSYNVASLHYLSSYNFWNMIYIYIYSPLYSGDITVESPAEVSQFHNSPSS